MIEAKLKHVLGEQALAIISLQAQLETAIAANESLKAEAANNALKAELAAAKEGDKKPKT